MLVYMNKSPAKKISCTTFEILFRRGIMGRWYMWEDFVQDIIEENFVIEGIIDGEEVKTKLPPEFKAFFREQKLFSEEL